MDYKILSKTVAHALRHDPVFYGLTLDENGFANLNDLAAAMQKFRRWNNLEVADFEKMILASEKKRFEIKEEKIRALYGHSANVNILKTPADPPAVLFHGTSTNNAAQILKNGLSAMERQFVHLSADRKTALIVGSRKSKLPIVLEIDTNKAANCGVKFYLGNDTIWLADAIPANCIRIA
ncbi:MAG: RNA 2'-phosphotransferase [Sphingobacteriales bacterium]|nr:MAG: RNA 2'-phosphotransferase [Sphingobacteriales bacterium]